MSVEKLKGTTLNVLSPKTETPIDYTEILKKLGLQETDIHAGIIQRLKEHLTLYKNGIEVNLALLEEKISTHPLGERISSLETWMTAEKERVAKSPENTVSGQTVTATMQDATNIVQNATANFEADQLAKVSEKLTASTTFAGLSKIPYIGSSLVETLSSWLINTGKDMQSGSAGFLGKIFFSLFAGAFGVKKILEAKAPVVPTVTVASPEVPTVLEAAPDSVVTTEEKPQETEKVLQKSASMVGVSSILSLSGIRIESNDNGLRNTILDEIKKLSFSEILEMKNTASKKETFLQSLGTTVNYAPMLDQVLEALSSQNSRDIIRISLSSMELEFLLTPGGKAQEKLSGLLGENKEIGNKRLQEIYTVLKNRTFKYEDLSLEEISLLYIANSPVLRASALPGIGDLGKELKNMGGDINTLSENLGVSYIDAGLIEKFGKISITDFGGNTMLVESFLREKLGPVSPTEELSLKELIAFKDFIVSSDFIDIPQLGMSIEHKAAFLKNLNYQSIIALYEMAGGNKTSACINPMTLPGIVLTISHVIGKVGENGSQNAFLAASYFGGYAKDIAMGNTQKLKLSEDEQKMLSIYSQKMLDVILFSYTMEFQAKLGLAEGVTGMELGELAMVSFGTGAGLNLLGNTLISKGIDNKKLSFLGKGLKKAGWIGILFGIAAGGAEILQMNRSTGTFEKDLKNASDTGDIQKAIAVLKAHKDSTHEYLINGEKLIVTAYPGDTPLVFYKGRIWNFTVVDESGSPELSISYIEELLKDSLSEKTDTLEGKDGSGRVSDVKIENGNLIFGDNIQTKKMDEMLAPGINMQEKQSANLAATVEDWFNSDIKDGERKRQIFGADYIAFLQGNRATYIPLAQISKKSYIAIQAIGEYNTQNP